MSTTPTVHTPVRTVARIRDVPILLVSVEIWPNEVCIRLGAGESDQTRRIDEEYSSALHELMESAAAQKKADTHLSTVEAQEQMKEDIRRRAASINLNSYKEVGVAISDDVGTDYKHVFASHDLGNERTWHIDEGFSPGPPSNASAMILEFSQASTMTSERLEISL